MRVIELVMRLAAAGVASLLALLRVRLVIIELDSMHAMCLKLDRYFKLVDFSMIPRRRTIILGQPGRAVGNPALVEYWRRQRRATIVAPESRLRYSLLFRASKLRPFVDPSPRTFTQWLESMLAVQARWEAEGRGPTLELHECDRERGWECLSRLGVEADAWFVCLHAREPGWRGEGETSQHRHTNADILTYLDAVELIREEGGWVIRMGDRSMKPLPKMERVIDYAHDPGRSDWMDIFLAAECRFFLGSASGLFGLPFLFGRPVALANVVPMSSRPWSSRDLFIPKLYWSVQSERLLTFEEAFQPPLRDGVHFDALEPMSVTVVDNTPREILELTREAIARERGRMTYTPEDEVLQDRFSALASTFLRYGTLSRIGADFIRAHGDLLPAEGSSAKSPAARSA